MPTRRIVTNTNISVDVLNALRNDASTNYREYVPVLTADAESLRGVGNILMDNPALLNEFISTLVNRIAFTIITSKNYTNRLGFLKKGMIELGETVEDIFINMAQPYQYDGNSNGNKIFGKYKPEVRASFYVMNAMTMYPVTVNRQLLKSAFTSVDGLNNFLESVIQTTYTGMEYDAQNIMMYLIARQVYEGRVKVNPITAITDEATAKNALVAIRATGAKMTMLSTASKEYNIAGVMNYLRPENAIVLLDADTRANIDVRALAGAFNIAYTDFENKTLVIPDFSEIDWDRLDVIFENDESYINLSNQEMSIPMFVMDEAFLQCYDNLLEMRDMPNPVSLDWNYFLHNWATYAVSPFACAVAFTPWTKVVAEEQEV